MTSRHPTIYESGNLKVHQLGLTHASILSLSLSLSLSLPYLSQSLSLPHTHTHTHTHTHVVVKNLSKSIVTQGLRACVCECFTMDSKISV